MDKKILIIVFGGTLVIFFLIVDLYVLQQREELQDARVKAQEAHQKSQLVQQKEKASQIEKTDQDEKAAQNDQEEPEPTVTPTPHKLGDKLHLSNSMGLVYSYAKPDFSKEELSWKGEQNDVPFEASDSTIYYYNSDPYGRNETTVSAYEIASQKTTELFTIPAFYEFAGALSPDGTKIAYLSHCEGTCLSRADDPQSSVRLYDISSGSDRELLSYEKGEKSIKAPQYWLDNNIVVLGYWSRRNEGGARIKELVWIDTSNDEITRYPLGSDVTSYDISPNQKKCAYTRFIWDQDAGTTTSSVEVKNFADDSVTTIVSSNSNLYGNIRWIDKNYFFVTTQSMGGIVQVGDKIDLNRLSINGTEAHRRTVTYTDQKNPLTVLDIVDGQLHYIEHIYQSDQTKQEVYQIIDMQSGVNKRVRSFPYGMKAFGNIRKH